jgi:hypothetical protein
MCVFSNKRIKNRSVPILSVLTHTKDTGLWRMRPSGLVWIGSIFWNYESFQTFWWDSLDEGSARRKTSTYTEKWGYTAMSRAGLEPTILVFERSKAIDATGIRNRTVCLQRCSYYTVTNNCYCTSLNILTDVCSNSDICIFCDESFIEKIDMVRVKFLIK